MPEEEDEGFMSVSESGSADEGDYNHAKRTGTNGLQQENRGVSSSNGAGQINGHEGDGNGQDRGKGKWMMPSGTHFIQLARPRALKQFTIESFHIGRILGLGTFGRVRLVIDRTSHHVYALKICKKIEIVRLQQVDHIKSEIRLLSLLNHPFVTSMAGYFQDECRLFMVLEYVVGGELFSVLRREKRFPEEKARFYAAEIVVVFEYLHAMNIVYRDLKPENVLIAMDGHIKLTDFGFAKIVKDKTWTLCGTPEYLAPEIIQSRGHGKSVDWWALGVLIYEMLASFPPFIDYTPMAIYEKIVSGLVEFPRYVSSKIARDVIKKFLVQDTKIRLGCDRHGASRVKGHKWFLPVDFKACEMKLLQPPWIPVVKSLDDTGNFDEYPEQPEEPPVPLVAEYRDMFKDI